MIITTILQIFSAFIKNCDPSNASDPSCQTTFPRIGASSDNVKIALQLVFGIISVATVIYIIIAAIRYQVSLGNPEATTKLRNTIIYAGIGLAIALSAEAIVTFTLGRV